MAEQLKLNLEENSRYRVAYELMDLIMTAETPDVEVDREYCLRLYRQCLECVFGNRSIEDIISGMRRTKPQLRIALR